MPVLDHGASLIPQLCLFTARSPPSLEKRLLKEKSSLLLPHLDLSLQLRLYRLCLPRCERLPQALHLPLLGNRSTRCLSLVEPLPGLEASQDEAGLQ